MEDYKYCISLIDKEGYAISEDRKNNISEAKKQAKYLLSDAYAQNISTTHLDLGTYKVEIKESKTNECIWDAFI